MCHRFSSQFAKLVYKWLNRQSQRKSYDWERFQDALAWVRWPAVKVEHHLSPMCRLPTLNEG